ncbi:MAG: serine hydrolase domain-containing protein [Pseudomonadota bacterium]
MPSPLRHPPAIAIAIAIAFYMDVATTAGITDDNPSLAPFALATAPACERPSTDTLIEQLDDAREHFDIPAYGLTLVAGDDTVFSGARGVANLESGQPVNQHTRFRIGSITKAFTSLAVVLAARDGDLSLDDRLDSLLDPVPMTSAWAQTHPVKLAQLLEHTSGLTDLTWDEMQHSDPAPLSLEDALTQSAVNRVARWPSGEHSSYSNAGSGIAARALEVHTGSSYEEFVARRIFEPLGMNTASILLDDSTRAHLATGYDTDAKSVIPYWHMLYRPFGAINVTTDDMAPFLKLLLSEGRLEGKQWLDTATVQRMETPTTTLSARAGLEYGYGLGVYSWYRNGWLFHGHGGDGDGYLAHFGYNRDFEMAYFVVITAFRHNALRRMRSTVENYIACMVNPYRPPRATLSAEERATLVGDYKQVTWRFGSGTKKRLQVIEKNEQLYTVHDGGVPRPLVPVTTSFFRRPYQTAATIAIIPDSTGTLVLQGDIGNFRKLGASE